MPMKELFHRLQPIQVYVVLVLSILYFMVQMFISQKSQSITLLVHAYHMLCNIIALSGCIITLKSTDKATKRLSHSSSESSADFENQQQQQKEIIETKKQQHEKSLKNTFGWARVDVLTMVIVCTFLTSLCFSIVVEVIQTLFHIEHKDHIEHEDKFHSYSYEICVVVGAIGLVLNGISYLLIGGYTYHQGSFLQLSEDGNVFILDRVVTDGRKISDSKAKIEQKSQKVHELSRDVCSAVIVIICSVIIVFCKEKESIFARLVDPILSLVSIGVLLVLSYPYMKEAASILLQTIPDTIDIEDFQKNILEKFPEIQSIHDLHIWQLTQQKFVSTAHFIFQDPSVYRHIIDNILTFFHEQGINIVTIQPEFVSLDGEVSTNVDEIKPLVDGNAKDFCLVACRQTTCEEKVCCKRQSSDDSGKSSDPKSKSDVQLEQIISVRNISAEELNTLSNSSSVKSLNLPESGNSSQVEINDKRSFASLYTPSKTRHAHKLQKAISAIDQEHQQIPTTSESDGIHLVSFKKFVSESMIKSSEQDNLNSDILVENRLLEQLNTTDNNETEDLHEKCDKET
ncbi:CLUMA_CG006173, isoform A [Clunio marinus]|uniref:CLUMA_CG006173, isoform A n=1 Tax=Clunio marinus TaxID=568069 RepID=A0A1J1HX04_9DIPT|nr:CLUMA_CG006173, isoform A [Clunio marinus]